MCETSTPDIQAEMENYGIESLDCAYENSYCLFECPEGATIRDTPSNAPPFPFCHAPRTDEGEVHGSYIEFFEGVL